MARWTVKSAEPRAERAWRALCEHERRCRCGRRVCGRRLELLREHRRWEDILRATRRVGGRVIAPSSPFTRSAPAPAIDWDTPEERLYGIRKGIEEDRAAWAWRRRWKRRRA